MLIKNPGNILLPEIQNSDCYYNFQRKVSEAKQNLLDANKYVNGGSIRNKILEAFNLLADIEFED